MVMFRATRQWFGSDRALHSVRLFLFELVVVTLGVLIAQWVQGLAQDRTARSHMENERVRARHELERVHMVADEWIAAVPCLDRRMTEIMSGRQPQEPGPLVRPSFPNEVYSPPDDEALILVERHYGPREKSVLMGLTTNVGNARTVTAKIIDNWGRFALIDPANGPVTAADRAQARIAAADIKAQLRSASIIQDDERQRLRTIGVGVSDDEAGGFGPARSCAAIWKSGRLDPPLTMR
jgi:hypothetical protein